MKYIHSENILHVNPCNDMMSIFYDWHHVNLHMSFIFDICQYNIDICQFKKLTYFDIMSIFNFVSYFLTCLRYISCQLRIDMWFAWIDMIKVCWLTCFFLSNDMKKHVKNRSHKMSNWHEILTCKKYVTI